MAEKMKIIALLLEDMSTDFSKDIIQSVEKAIPKNKDIRLIVLSGKNAEDQNDRIAEEYGRIYNRLYSLAMICDIKGIIIHMGSISHNKKQLIESGFPERIEKLPKVFISSELEDRVTVNYDNESGIREAIECIINVNGKTKLCMLGGRDDNYEARARKAIFIKCIRENGIMFREKMYESSDMSINTEAAAGRLLDRNPNVEAIFCVNDGSAVGLYKAMKKRGLVPGKDILVFGFDNTRMACDMKPPLASVGPSNVTVGHKAVELLLDMINGEKVYSQRIPTKLYGRGSFPYDMYEYTAKELLSVDKGAIYRMFDDCFFRYNSEYVSRESIDLRRLFYEMISRMLTAMNKRYISMEEFGEIGRLIDIFFNAGAMDYTDAEKFIRSVNRLQDAIVVVQKRSMATANVYINRLFLRMKDRAVTALSEKNILENNRFSTGMEKLHSFLLKATGSIEDHGTGLREMFRNMADLGLKDAALYIFDEPVIADTDGGGETFPENIRLCSAVKDGELRGIPEERRERVLSKILSSDDVSAKCKGYAVFPVFFRDRIYGFLMSALTDDLYTRGELIAMLLGRTIYLSGNI